MALFRNKSTGAPLEAVQIAGISPSTLVRGWYDIAVVGQHFDWVGEALDNEFVVAVDPVAIEVKTHDGPRPAVVGDWIARGPNDEVYPISAKLFDETYEPMPDEPALTTDAT